MSITSNLNSTKIKEALAEATGRARPKPSALDRARSRAAEAVSEARGSLHQAAERARQSGRDLTDGVSGSRDERARKRVVATVGAVGAAGAAGAYFLRDRIGSTDRQNGQVPTPAGQTPVSSADADGANSA
jgi:glutathione S-transferase